MTPLYPKSDYVIYGWYLNSTAIPTNTVEARKAWLRMEEKFTRLPMHFKVGSDTIPSITDELELKIEKQL
jgi:hypothetical protein